MTLQNDIYNLNAFSMASTCTLKSILFKYIVQTNSGDTSFYITCIGIERRTYNYFQIIFRHTICYKRT